MCVCRRVGFRDQECAVGLCIFNDFQFIMKHILIVIVILIIIVIAMSLDVVNKVIQQVGRLTGNDKVTLWNAEPKTILMISIAVILLIILTVFSKRK